MNHCTGLLTKVLPHVFVHQKLKFLTVDEIVSLVEARSADISFCLLP
jgi:hypothetical protein